MNDPRWEQVKDYYYQNYEKLIGDKYERYGKKNLEDGISYNELNKFIECIDYKFGTNIKQYTHDDNYEWRDFLSVLSQCTTFTNFKFPDLKNVRYSDVVLGMNELTVSVEDFDKMCEVYFKL